MPAWLAAIIRGFGPGQANYLDAISDELKALLADLKVPPQTQAPVPGASVPAKPAADDARPKPAGEAAQTKAKPPTPPAPPKPQPPVFERPPELIGLRTPEQIKERALEGRAAKFYPQSHQVFINLSYPSVRDMAATLLAETALQGSPLEEAARRLATETAEWALTRRISRAIVYSLSKKGLGWRPEEVSRSQSTESLSLVADDWAAALDMARRHLQDRMGEDLPIALPRPVAA